MMILIEKPEYPEESMFKFFHISYYQEVEWNERILKACEYLCIEGKRKNLLKMIKYLDIIEYAEILNDEHIWLINTHKRTREYRGKFLNLTKEYVEVNKKVIYLHFKHSDFYMGFDGNSVKPAINNTLH